MKNRIHTVLVVDDSDDARAELCDLLVAEGFQVLEANDGLKALHLLRSLPPDVGCLILLDLRMPVMSGQELLEELRQIERCTRFPVIVVSGIDGLEDARRLPCVVDVVGKPFDAEALLQRVREETRPIGSNGAARPG